MQTHWHPMAPAALSEDEKINILLVNDRPMQLTAWQASLASLNENLVLARSGVEALDQLLTQDFAVILLDVNMPIMDGFETATLIRQRPRLEHTPILFVTAINTEEHDRLHGYNLGAVDYIFTPVVPEILRAKVKVFVDLHRKSLEVTQQATQLATLNELLEQQLEEIKQLYEELQTANASLRAETTERQRAELSLRQAHDELEIRVRDRTAALDLANAELKREIVERQQAAARTARLQAATAALSQAVTPAQVAEVILRQSALAFKAVAGGLAVFSEDRATLELVAAIGYPEDLNQILTSLALSEDFPLTEAVRTGQPIWLDSQIVVSGRYTRFGELRGPLECQACVAIPLLLDGQVLGGMVLELAEPREFKEDEQEFLLTLGRQCAQALERARLYVEARKHNAELEQNVRKRTAELENSQIQLRNLSARMTAMREEERARLSREIHDELGGSLTAMKITATQIRRGYPDDETLQTQSKNLLELIDDTIQKVRQIATDLRPSILDDFGLLAALEWQLQEFQRRSEIECQLLPSTKEVVVDRDSATAIFRIFQETLTNVARHAQATRVVVSLEQAANYLLLSVQDNGRGISTKELVQSKSLGLAGMRERVHLLSGQLNIQGKPGQGTIVQVKIPLPAQNGAGAADSFDANTDLPSV